MMREISALCDSAVVATDGLLGRVEEMLIDDEHWTLGFVIIKLSFWRPGGKILLPVDVFGDLRWGGKVIQVNMTRQEAIKERIGGKNRRAGKPPIRATESPLSSPP